MNIEARFFAEGRLARLTKRLSWSIRVTIGSLVCLWHDSQEELRTTGTAQEIIRWMRVDLDDDETNTYEHIIENLVDCEYINQVGDDEFSIVGNNKQVENIAKYKKRSSKGGEATKAKWAKIREGEGLKQASKPSDAVRKQATEELEPGYIQCSSVQCSSVQFNSNQKNARERATPDGATSLIKYSTADRSLAEDWVAYASEIRSSGKHDVEKFADAIRKAKKRAKLNDDEMRLVFEFIRQDDFWCDKAFSPCGLTKASKSNGEPKIANIVAAMKRHPAVKTASIREKINRGEECTF